MYTSFPSSFSSLLSSSRTLEILLSHSFPRLVLLLGFGLDLGHGLWEECSVGLWQQEGEEAGDHGGDAEENEGKGVVNFALRSKGGRGLLV